MKPFKHFTYDELLRVARWTSGEEAPDASVFPEDAIEKLELARLHAGVPFIVNSSYRSEAYEISKGRSGTSAHTLGRAFDIRCTDSRTRYRIISGALDAGYKRIGIYPNFIHLDDSPVHDQMVIWYGK